MQLNFHHLRYFRAVATEGNLTRAAGLLRVSPSALSMQIRQLEEQLGQALFSREGRRLQLTEAGRIALTYAEQIFTAGSELVGVLREGRRREQQLLRVGAVATLSRNFQETFLRPALEASGVELRLQSGSLGELLARLSAHTLDLVLCNQRVRGDAENGWRCQRIARQPVSLVGRQRRPRFSFPLGLAGAALLLPGRGSDVRSGFELLCEQQGLRVEVRAEVDDMAMLRLLARATDAIALVPTIVVREELRRKLLFDYGAVPGLYEEFFAVSIKRHYPHPWVKRLLAQSEEQVLAME